ncbi:MAG TPA: zf-TFIIB domain-containing protein [Gaiellales bacterium]|nr:zf-TFIIB domain-containing protein [Gaiellales bacterium]
MSRATASGRDVDSEELTTMTPSPDAPVCPACQAPLALSANGLTAFWSCPNSHGAACTVTAAYSHIDGDEIRKLWHASENAPAGSKPCPMCGGTMAEVPAGPDTAPAPVDVCRADELFWLDAGELDQLPQPTPEAPATPEEERNLAAIRQTFDEGLDQSMRAHEGHVDRFVDRLTGRHPAFTPMIRHGLDDAGAGDRVA